METKIAWVRYRKNLELEKQVAERTAELVMSNVLLQQEITERQRAEAALQQNENFYRQLVESQTDIIIRIDLQGQIIFANMAACQTFGWKRDEFRSQSFFQFLHPDDLPQVMANITLKSLFDLLTNCERRAFTVNGIRWFQWNAIAIRNDKGDVVKIQGVGRDITEQQAARQDYELVKEALRQSEEKFRNFSENTHAVIWIASPDSLRTLYVSPAYERIWGRSCQSLLEHPESWIDIVHPDDRSRVSIAAKQQLNGDSASAEYRILRPDGSVRWIWDRSFTVYNNQGKIQSHSGIAEDITERKLSQESLQESEARLNLAIEAVQLGIWDRNLIANTAIWSANMGPLYGLPNATLCPTFEDYLNLIHPEDREFVAASRVRMIEEGKLSIEYRIIWPDGSLHWLNCKSQTQASNQCCTNGYNDAGDGRNHHYSHFTKNESAGSNYCQ